MRISDWSSDVCSSDLLVLAGGVDSLSLAPVLLSDDMVNWLAAWGRSRSLSKKLATLKNLRPQYLTPVIGLLKGLTDPVVGLSMGQTAENLAHEFGISRQAMDAYAAQSHQRALAAQQGGAFQEIAPLVDQKGQLYSQDDGIRTDPTPTKLAQIGRAHV